MIDIYDMLNEVDDYWLYIDFFMLCIYYNLKYDLILVLFKLLFNVINNFNFVFGLFKLLEKIKFCCVSW